MTTKIFTRITCDPAVCLGQPVVAGTRIPVASVLKGVAHGVDYPELDDDAIREALEFAAALVESLEFTAALVGSTRVLTNDRKQAVIL